MGAPTPTTPADAQARACFNALPQYGFATELAFDKLVERNPFLFRVYTPKSSQQLPGSSTPKPADPAFTPTPQPPAQLSRAKRLSAGTPRPQSPFIHGSSDPYFIGQKFTAEVQETEPSDYFSMPVNDSASEDSTASSSPGSYEDAVKHLDWTTRSTSPYISTSFSFAWAIWEAARRYQNNMKHDVHIAVIDARALMGRAVTALSLLREGAPSQRHKDHWKWYRWASEGQDVLVFGSIPSKAVLASVPLVSILDKLPSYFLRADGETSPTEKEDSPFNQLAWDHYTKPNFKQFSQDMSDKFARLPVDRRTREITTGAVRLAVTLLAPYVHETVLSDSQSVSETLTTLSLLIAQWPAQWWARERAAEVRSLVRGTTVVLVEEIKEARRLVAVREVERLQGLVDDVHKMAEEYYSAPEPAPAPAPGPKKEVHFAEPSSATTPTAAPAAKSSIADTSVPLRAEPPRTPSKQRTLLPTILAGVWFGTVLTMSVFSSPRWELAHHLT